MAAKKKSAKKKRQISKHVLKARESKNANDVSKTDGNGTNQETPTESPTKEVPPQTSKTSDKSKHVKDPAEAAAYLTNWANRQEQPDQWKFNKNTQSWLIRHMYEVDKVPKATFKLLMDYLDGLKGDTMRSRIRTEASRRALRYKEHVKKSNSESAKENDNTEKDGKDDAEQSEANDKTAVSKREQLEEESRWQALDENDKRKEYKRARIVLDAFKA